MSFKARTKKKFIRWYCGEWVNDPYNEVIMFGLMPTRGARRLMQVLQFLRIRLK